MRPDGSAIRKTETATLVYLFSSLAAELIFAKTAHYRESQIRNNTKLAAELIFVIRQQTRGREKAYL